MADYKATLNLPKTSFPMRANLAKNEPKMLNFWDANNIYSAMARKDGDRPPFVLHDGPPYANGNIHLGTAMNKVLKDMIVKYKNMQGHNAEYVPGWDCHGLPIELKVERELGSDKKSMSILDIRKQCREYALKYLDIQREEFKKLGVLGTWDAPYLTMNPSYEAATARELARFMERGSVVRNKKPIYWCCSCETALAEAEVEYGEHTSPSIYVRFPLPDDRLRESIPQADPDRTSLVIWTTTPWTIPDNMAVAVHPDLEYVLVRAHGNDYLLAEELWQERAEGFGWETTEILGRVSGAALEGLNARHPLYNRHSPIVLADYVSTDAGTGCVHTAPGHGQEDFETGQRYGLEVYSPLDDQGRFLSSVPFFAGLTVFEANPEVIAKLQEFGMLLAQEEISHSYPHCWRCKKPVIFRATTQWFISMEANGLRDKALKAIDSEVQWIPSWGRERIHSMIANRPDWCISRQRMWGVPIIALLCEGCGEAYYEADWVHAIVDRFAEHERGADYWFEASLEDIVPEGLTCPSCGGTHWAKEDDILDVWFDSGTSFAAVVEQRDECRYPADLYLEGTDQHRGWFHSSLLASVGTRDQAPYKTVLTHGFVVDGQGRKMSKSIGNVVAPQEIMDKYGAEILRMWVASENYQEDLRISENILKQLVDAYRRIRNTCRFILGNLADFDPSQNGLPLDEVLSFDRYALDLIQTRHQRMQEAYSRYEFHKVFHTLHHMCVTDLSAFYLDILKDRLYVSAPGSIERRSAQTVLHRILQMLLRDMAPFLSFTAEELFQHLPECMRPDVPSVFTLSPVEPVQDLLREDERALWDHVCSLREEITKAIEPWRKSGDIGHPLSAAVTIYAPEPLHSELSSVAGQLREICIVSQASLEQADSAPEDAGFASDVFPGLSIAVNAAQGDKCPRCWVFSPEIGSDAAHPDVCPRCSAVLQQL
ncbi:isoleucine--tRNA ligase [Desulfohalobium retbaense]|uniref:Isoleucine--tRNA ligase n=1 Tax=Desulfohalobium retbaense (strain ATCC 49708 / DSM 5692 / JCM 16813 / HR100) TaxID=485915 RepID=C8X283_DESRD|nr:isoleucine--tRNA ligase [Desulfohalobium retbaense]ACV68406.1 isoleucyl-tRNA synthetase [Desulfohalobium retbaense DSM 5692]